jgi:hypothetical protein
MKRILAIDPGASGGFAWRDIDGKVKCCAIPKEESEVVRLIRSLQQVDFVLLEHVGGYMPGKFTPGSGMFNFGCGYGVIKGAMIAFNMDFKIVAPHKWQKDLGMGAKKDYDYKAILTRGRNKGKEVIKSGWKIHLQMEAIERFAGIRYEVTLKTADALLMLNYAERFL